MEQWLLCRPQLNSRKVQYCYIWLPPKITPFILSNLFIGHWDMMDLVNIHVGSTYNTQQKSIIHLHIPTSIPKHRIQHSRIWHHLLHMHCLTHTSQLFHLRLTYNARWKSLVDPCMPTSIPEHQIQCHWIWIQHCQMWHCHSYMLCQMHTRPWYHLKSAYIVC